MNLLGNIFTLLRHTSYLGTHQLLPKHSENIEYKTGIAVCNKKFFKEKCFNILRSQICWLNTKTFTFFEFYLVPEVLIHCRVVAVAKLKNCREPSSALFFLLIRTENLCAFCYALFNVDRNPIVGLVGKTK